MLKSIETTHRVLFSDNPTSLDVGIAQLSVAYEDLRIELAGCEVESLGSMDSSGPALRKIYFIRRVLATLREVRELIRCMWSSTAFRDFRLQLPADVQGQLDAAKRTHDEHDTWVKNLRNGIGGHIDRDAVASAVATLARHGTEAHILVQIKPNETTRIHLQFASDIGAAVMLPDVENISKHVAMLHGRIHLLATATIDLCHLMLNHYIADRLPDIDPDE